MSGDKLKALPLYRSNHDERYYRWMSEKRAQQWVRDMKNIGRAERVRAKMRAIGMALTEGRS